MNNAPSTLREACDIFEIEHAKSKFGFEKDKIKLREIDCKENINPNNNKMVTSCVKAESVKITPVNHHNNNKINGQRYTPSIANDRQYHSGTFSTPQIVTPAVKAVNNDEGCSPSTGLARFQQNATQNDRIRNFTKTNLHFNQNSIENVVSTLAGKCLNENTNLKRTFSGSANRNTGPLKKSNQSTMPINPYATKKKASS